MPTQIRAHKGRTILSALKYKLNNQVCKAVRYRDTPNRERTKINYKGIIPLYIVIVKQMYSIYRYFKYFVYDLIVLLFCDMKEKLCSGVCVHNRCTFNR